MRASFAIKTLLLGSMALVVVGFPGCDGGSGTTQPTSAEVKDDAKRTQDRQDIIKQQYQNKTATPAK